MKKKASKKTLSLLTIVIAFLLAITPTIEVFAINNVTTISKPKYEAPPTPHTNRSTTNTINFHGHKLIRSTIPDWLMEALEKHSSTCNEWAEAEMTRIIHGSNQKDSFAITEAIDGERKGFAFCDAATGAVQVGDTESSIGKPTVHIDLMDSRNINQLVKEHGFSLVLSIMDKLNSEPSPEEEADSVRISIEELANQYETRGWATVSERGVSLLTKTPKWHHFETAFWTDNYEHYVAIGSSNSGSFILGDYDELGAQELFVDGKFISKVPEEYPIDIDSALESWSKGDLNKTTYSWSHGRSRSAIVCDKEGHFAAINNDCMLYKWDWEGEKANTFSWWTPTFSYPLLKGDVVEADSRYVSSSGNQVKIYGQEFSSDAEQFGIYELFNITFKGVGIAQAFTCNTGIGYDEKPAPEVYVAVPESNTIWYIGENSIGRAKLDQVEVLNESVFARNGDTIKRLAFKKYDGWDGNEVDFLNSLQFEEIMEWDTFWTFIPKEEYSMKSADGQQLILEFGDITVAINGDAE